MRLGKKIGKQSAIGRARGAGRKKSKEKQMGRYGPDDSNETWGEYKERMEADLREVRAIEQAQRTLAVGIKMLLDSQTQRVSFLADILWRVNNEHGVGHTMGFDCKTCLILSEFINAATTRQDKHEKYTCDNCSAITTPFMYVASQKVCPFCRAVWKSIQETTKGCPSAQVDGVNGAATGPCSPTQTERKLACRKHGDDCRFTKMDCDLEFVLSTQTITCPGCGRTERGYEELECTHPWKITKDRQ